MPLGRATRRRSVVAIVAVAAAGALSTLLLPPGPAAGAPPFSLDERAAAIASPSLVYLEARIEGYLRIKSTGALVDTAPAVVTSQCSGFVVGAEGYVVTTTHCLQPSNDSLRGAAAYIVTNNLIKQNKLTAAQKAGFIKDLMASAEFGGATKGTAPATTVVGQLYVATGGLTSAPAIPGQVVDSQPVSKGDVSLVKLGKQGLPVAQLEQATPGAGTHVVQLAFGTDDSASDKVTYTVRSRGASVLGRYSDRTTPMYRMDGDLGATAGGGMVVDSDGHVIGMINADMAKDRTTSLYTDLATIRDELQGSGVKNEPGAADRNYLAALDAYFGGQYADAVKKFDTVLAGRPDNKLAQNYREQARLRLTIEGGGRAGGTRWLPVALGAGAVAVLVAALLVTVVALRRRARRRREERDRLAPDPFARRPSDPDPFWSDPFAAPVSGAPVSGAPLSGADLAEVPAAPTSGAGSGASPFAPPASPADPPPYRAGVPVPVSAPPGIPVQHPAWGAPAPVRLPDWVPNRSEPVQPEQTERAADERGPADAEAGGAATPPPEVTSVWIPPMTQDPARGE
jgi:hypothetical protein